MPLTAEHDHAEPPAGAARRHRQSRRFASPLAAGAGTRLGWAAGAILALWLAVWWALA